MRYSTEPKFRKYVEGCDFLSFSKKRGDKYGRTLMDTARKREIDTAQTISKIVVQKTTEVTGDFIGNKIAVKITSTQKQKVKKKKLKQIKNKKFTNHKQNDSK